MSESESDSVFQSNTQDSDTQGFDESSGSSGSPASTAGQTSTVEQVRSTVVRINTDVSSGSGVIVQTQDSTGYVVTNEHVIDGASQINVTVNDSAVYDAQLLGVDAVRDLAVLTICCSTFQSIQFGDVSNLRPTAEAVIVGYPHSLPGQATFTQGIVSAVRFNSELQSEVFQTDAAINPGNSGGAMVSLGGELLGIVTFKLSESEGVGFAVSAGVVLQQLPVLWANASSPPLVPTPVLISHSGIDESVLEERIQELLEELVPTAMIGTTPVPLPTLGGTAIRELATHMPPPPTQTPAPLPTATPTPHPCNLAEIAPADELEITYTGWLVATPYYQSVNNFAKSVLQDKFVDVAAAYTIEFMAEPRRYTSFRDYLGKVGLAADGDWMRMAFQTLLDVGLLPSPDESLYEYNQRRAADPCTPARSRVFADDEIMTLLAVSYLPQAINPALRRGYSESIVNAIYAFRDSDPTTPLIYWVIERHNSLAE